MTEATNPPRKLGKNQVEFLRLLSRHKGVWHPRSRWVWKAPSETVRLLEPLEARGLVSRRGEEWRLTDAGRSALREIRETGESRAMAHAA